MKRAALVLGLALTACASGPPPPEWAVNARSSSDAAISAYLRGNTKLAEIQFRQARDEIASTGRLDLLARLELTRCAAQVASLEFDECPRFKALRVDAPSADRAYADYLQARVDAVDIDLLPPQHRAVARALTGPGVAPTLDGINDPLARLVAAGVLLRASKALSALRYQASDTASEQGWRRPLLAWLSVQLRTAQQSGEADRAGRLRRRIDALTGELKSQ
jgi:hypothetical protein